MSAPLWNTENYHSYLQKMAVIKPEDVNNQYIKGFHQAYQYALEAFERYCLEEKKKEEIDQNGAGG